MTAPFELREIKDEDLPVLVPLLCEGFPRSRSTYWATGLQRLRNRECPPDTAKYGYVLTSENRPRGAVLTISSFHGEGSQRSVFVNISSWYVQPAFRGGPAKELLRHACRRADVTYTNLSPAPHTIRTIEALGFEQWSAGQMLVLGLASHRAGSTKARILPPSEWLRPELSGASGLLREHERFGCLAFHLESSTGLSSFIFVRRYVKGFIPCAQLIYCRSLADLTEHCATISRWLLLRGFPLMLIDASAPIQGLVGSYVHGKSRKFFRGPQPAQLVDHTYSEMAFFGF